MLVSWFVIHGFSKPSTFWLVGLWEWDCRSSYHFLLSSILTISSTLTVTSFNKIFKSIQIFSEIKSKLFPVFTMVEFFVLLPGYSFDIFKCILNVKFLPELLKGWTSLSCFSGGLGKVWLRYTTTSWSIGCGRSGVWWQKNNVDVGVDVRDELVITRANV